MSWKTQLEGMQLGHIVQPRAPQLCPQHIPHQWLLVPGETGNSGVAKETELLTPKVSPTEPQPAGGFLSPEAARRPFKAQWPLGCWQEARCSEAQLWEALGCLFAWVLTFSFSSPSVNGTHLADHRVWEPVTPSAPCHRRAVLSLRLI